MKIPERDLDILNKLVFVTDAEPSFELLKYCLVWSDERPLAHLSVEGQEFLSDLWIVRGFIHRSLPNDQWGLDPKYFTEVWEFGLLNAPYWPGFRRLSLSEADSAYLVSCIGTSSASL
jgi:hypothetical protein